MIGHYSQSKCIRKNESGTNINDIGNRGSLRMGVRGKGCVRGLQSTISNGTPSRRDRYGVSSTSVLIDRRAERRTRRRAETPPIDVFFDGHVCQINNRRANTAIDITGHRTGISRGSRVTRTNKRGGQGWIGVVKPIARIAKSQK